MRNNLPIRLIKGFVIGASMLIPGASGGTMAIILGIYDDLIHAVSSLKEDVKTHGLLLVQYGVAGIAGILLLSGVILDLITAYPKPMLFLFLGAILGSIPALYKKATASVKIRKRNLSAVLIGALCGLLISLFPEGVFVFSEGFGVVSFIMLFLAGIVIAIALVLPGISASYILLMLGMYDLTLLAIKDFNLLFLTPLALGAIFGTFLTAGILEKEMHRHPQFTYLLIIGFMLGSLLEVFPGFPAGMEIVSCTGTFIIGLAAILWMQVCRKDALEV